MANTTIQLKYSTVTSTPSSLNVAEPAYSYTSNTLFIGSPSGTGSIAIGGKFYVDQQANIFNLVNAAFTQANSAGSSDLVLYAANKANGAFIKANTVGDTAISAFYQANAAFSVANSASSAASSAQGTADGAATAASNAQGAADNAQNTASAAYARANNSLSANSGGTVTGDVTITGSLIVSGQTIYANTTSVQLGDNIITLNADLPTSIAPSENAGFEVNRGNTLANASILWVEASGKWQANSGSATGAYFLGAESDGVYANGAFVQANAAFGVANSATSTGTSAFIQANAAYGKANTVGDTATSAFIQANAAFDKANTDFTDINISSADYGSASSVSSFRVAANGRIISANSTSISVDASAISSGILGVARGGTGNNALQLNSVLIGQGTSAVTAVGSSIEGHILTINNSGVPTFSHLQGGTL